MWLIRTKTGIKISCFWLKSPFSPLHYYLQGKSEGTSLFPSPSHFPGNPLSPPAPLPSRTAWVLPQVNVFFLGGPRWGGGCLGGAEGLWPPLKWVTLSTTGSAPCRLGYSILPARLSDRWDGGWSISTVTPGTERGATLIVIHGYLLGHCHV